MSAVEKDGMKLFDKVGKFLEEKVIGSKATWRTLWHTWDLYVCTQSLGINLIT